MTLGPGDTTPGPATVVGDTTPGSATVVAWTITAAAITHYTDGVWPRCRWA